ncbi:MAG: hypothetical protein JNJ45_05930 [Chthonomonas sp.]|nr:hypothetical protein [Chthonomonas sp.]
MLTLKQARRIAPALLLSILVLQFLAGCAGIFGGGSSAVAGTALLKAGGVSSHIVSSRSRELAYATLKIRTSVATSEVSATGEGSTMIYNGGPQFAEVVDAEGRTVFSNYVSATAPDFTVATTARSLAYLVLAGPGLKREGRIKLLEEVNTISGYSDLEAAILAQHNALGYLDVDDAAIKAALETMTTSAYNRGRGVIVEPTNRSGLAVDTSVDSALTVQNTYLRRVQLYFRRTGYKDAAGNQVDENNEYMVQDIPLVARYGGVTGTLDGFLKGDVAYSPQSNTPAFLIPRYPATAKQTQYEVYALGPGGHLGDFSAAPADIKNAQGIVELKALFLDAFLVFIANVAIPVGGDEIDGYLKFVGANAAVTDLIGNLKTNVPQLGELLGQGQYMDALKALVNSAYTSNTILPFLAQLTLDFIDQNANLSDATYDQIFNGFKGLLDKMGKIDIGFTIADLVILFADVARSNKIDRFEVISTPGKVTLQVGRTPLRPTQKTTVRAIIQDKDPAGTYEYRWRVSPNNNYWLDDRDLDGTDDAVGGILITGDDVVEANSFITTKGTATVDCEVWRVDGSRRKVADADSVNVVFDPEATNVSTANYVVQVESRTYELSSAWVGRYSGDYAIYALVPKTDLAFYYRFTGTGATASGYNYQYGRYTPIPNDVLGAASYSEYLTAPAAGYIKVMLKSGWDGLVGGHSTQAAARASLDANIAPRLVIYNSMSHVVEAYLPDN